MQLKYQFLTVSSRPSAAFFISAEDKSHAIAKAASLNGGTVIICAEISPFDRAHLAAINAKWAPLNIG
jgi:hypothetical protein